MPTRKRGWVALALGVAVLVGFAAYARDVVLDVSGEREAVEQRVSVLIRLQRLQSALDGLREGVSGRGDLVEARVAVELGRRGLEEIGALEEPIDISLQAVLSLTDERLEDHGVGEASASTEHEAVGRAIAAVRAANGAGSERLGESWERLEMLAWISILFAALILALLTRIYRIAQRLTKLEGETRARLSETEYGFQRVVEASPYGIVLLHEGVIEHANANVVRTLGRSTAELLGRRLTEFVDDETIQEGVLEDGEYSFRTNTAPAHVEVVHGPEVLFEGSPRRLCVLRDVSERRAMESQLRQADRLSALGTVAAGIAHEINNPLAYVLANANVLRSEFDSLDLDPVARAVLIELADDVREGAARVRDVVRGLRTLSHPSDEELGPVALGAVVSSAYAIAESELSHRAEVSVDIPASTPNVHANEGRLGQVVLNLLVNAAQAFPDDHPKLGRVVVRSAFDGTHVSLVISDNGPGMSAEVLSQVFEPFFTTKPVGEGTGLGLTICRSIIESFGGELALASTLGEGTAVTLRVPIDDAPKSVEPARKRSATPSHAASVLIVDDEDRVGASLARLLRGHHCVRATSGAEALELMDKQRFDIVFCDLMMPDVTGMDVFEALREQGGGQEQQLVFVTGGAFTARAQEFVSACPNIVIEKPFDAALVRKLTEDSVGLRPNAAPAPAKG